MRASRFAPLAVFVASALIHPVSAQAPDVGKTKSIGFTGGVALTYGNLTGGDFDGTKAGAGFDLNAGITRGAWQLGLGYDRTNHGHEDSSGDFVVSNLYVEPRFQVASATRRLTPYVAARVGKAMGVVRRELRWNIGRRRLDVRTGRRHSVAAGEVGAGRRRGALCSGFARLWQRRLLRLREGQSDQHASGGADLPVAVGWTVAAP